MATVTRSLPEGRTYACRSCSRYKFTASKDPVWDEENRRHWLPVGSKTTLCGLEVR